MLVCGVGVVSAILVTTVRQVAMIVYLRVLRNRIGSQTL